MPPRRSASHLSMRPPPRRWDSSAPAVCTVPAIRAHPQVPLPRLKMTVHALFPTLVYAASLQKGDTREFNRQLLKECRQLRADDAAGRRWSLKNYAGGYTSYGSVHRLQSISPTFDALRRDRKSTRL